MDVAARAANVWTARCVPMPVPVKSARRPVKAKCVATTAAVEPAVNATPERPAVPKDSVSREIPAPVHVVEKAPVAIVTVTRCALVLATVAKTSAPTAQQTCRNNALSVPQTAPTKPVVTMAAAAAAANVQQTKPAVNSVNASSFAPPPARTRIAATTGVADPAEHAKTIWGVLKASVKHALRTARIRRAVTMDAVDLAANVPRVKIV